MEEALVLKAEVREHTGSKYAAKVRKERRIPAVVYGHKEKPVAISLDAHKLVEGLHHGRRVMDVKIGKKLQKVMVKDLQYDHLGKDIIHVDLMRVDVTEMVEVSVPIELKGTAKGAEGGGVIEEQTDRLEVRCRVTDIPESIVISIKDVDVGDSVRAGEVELPEGVTLVSDPETVVLNCALVAAAKTTEELEEEVPVAPEVIGEAKETEEKEGESSEEKPEKGKT
jgi:large subunit ribosomal protein L25